MISIQRIVFHDAAVRLLRRLRFSVPVFWAYMLLPLLILCGCSSGAGEPVLEPVLTSEKEDPSFQARDRSGLAASLNDESAPQTTVTVHICGAVRKEGVYILPTGSRIRDAVEAAGGFSENADRSWLNLAMQIEDGWQIRVPSKEETEKLLRPQGDPGQETAGEAAPEALGITDGTDTPFIVRGEGSSQDLSDGSSKTVDHAAGRTFRINLNTASKEELMKIPGVGETKAQRIIDYRELNGRFEAVEDLMKVPGIKDASFQKMKAFITV